MAGSTVTRAMAEESFVGRRWSLQRGAFPGEISFSASPTTLESTRCRSPTTLFIADKLQTPITGSANFHENEPNRILDRSLLLSITK